MAKNTLSKLIVIAFCATLALPLLAIMFYIVKNGFHAINVDFFTQVPKPMGELGGGIANAIVGSALIIFTACIIAIPTGIFTGIYLSENRTNRITNYIRLAVDMIQGIPSIVIGIIAYLWIVVPMGHFSALSGGLALSVMMLPVVTKSTEETLKRIHPSIKEAALALGAPYYRTILLIIVPTGLQGITTGVLLGIARIAGESAPLLFTAFGSPFMSTHISKPVSSLPLLIFNYATSPYEDWQRLAWGASLLLLVFVLTLSLLSKAVTKK
jgi:phosphate transport system permease protein